MTRASPSRLQRFVPRPEETDRSASRESVTGWPLAAIPRERQVRPMSAIASPTDEKRKYLHDARQLARTELLTTSGAAASVVISSAIHPPRRWFESTVRLAAPMKRRPKHANFEAASASSGATRARFHT